MNPTLVALFWLPCASASYQAALSNETVIYSCPDTVKYIYQTERPVGVSAKPVAAESEPVAVKKRAAPKKKYRKRRKRK